MNPPLNTTPPASPLPPHFARHVFFCTNQREDGKTCCATQCAEAAAAHCKQRVKDLGLSGAEKVRVNKAGCLGRCSAGPVAVVYPEGVWYSYVDLDDIDEIVERHVLRGEVVERLLVPPRMAE